MRRGRARDRPAAARCARGELEAVARRRATPIVRRVGRRLSPGTIAAAVWDGRRYAEELDAPPGDDTLPPFRREVVQLAAP